MKLLCCRISLWMKAVFSPPIHLCCGRRRQAVKPTLCTLRLHDPVLRIYVCLYPTWTSGETDRRGEHAWVSMNFAGDKWWRRTRTAKPSPLLSAWSPAARLRLFPSPQPCRGATTHTHTHTHTHTQASTHKRPSEERSTCVSHWDSGRVYNVVTLSPSHPTPGLPGQVVSSILDLLSLCICPLGTSREALVNWINSP